MRSKVLIGLAVASIVAGGAAATSLGALAALPHGQWQFKEIGVASPPRNLCVADAVQLIQLNHPGEPCSRFVIENAPNKATVQYNCQKRGYGRTTVTLQEAGVIRLDTQGIDAEGQPFDTSYEGRLAGACGAAPRR